MPVRDNDRDAAAAAHGQHRLGERALSFDVEAGVGLVEHHQKRRAIERTRERDALALPRRERDAVGADLGAVARGELCDQGIDAGSARGGRDCLRAPVRVEAANVLSDRS